MIRYCEEKRFNIYIYNSDFGFNTSYLIYSTKNEKHFTGEPTGSLLGIYVRRVDPAQSINLMGFMSRLQLGQENKWVRTEAALI